MKISKNLLNFEKLREKLKKSNSTKIIIDLLKWQQKKYFWKKIVPFDSLSVSRYCILLVFDILYIIVYSENVCIKQRKFKVYFVIGRYFSFSQHCFWFRNVHYYKDPFSTDKNVAAKSVF